MLQHEFEQTQTPFKRKVNPHRLLTPRLLVGLRCVFVNYMNSIRLSIFLGLSFLLGFTFFLGSCRSVAEYRGTRAPGFASPYRVAAVEKSWMARHKYDHDRRLLIPVHKGTRWGAVQEYKEDGSIVFRDWWVRNVKVEDLEANPETDVVKAEKPEPASLPGENSFVPAPTIEPSIEPFLPNPSVSIAPEPAPFSPEPFPVTDASPEIAPFEIPPTGAEAGGMGAPSPFTPLPGAVQSAPLPGTAMPPAAPFPGGGDPAAFPNPGPGAPPGLGLPVMEQPLVPPIDPGVGPPMVPGGGNAPMPANPFAPAPGGLDPAPGNPPAMENPFPPPPGGPVPDGGPLAPDPAAPAPIEANPFAPAPGGPAPGGGDAPMPANPFAPAPSSPAPTPVPGGEAPLPVDPFGPAVKP